ncbi:MAG: cysteine--tRNA ligase [Candidatus Aenigmatarchaeota archaeon]
MLQFYNTLNRKKETFKTLKPGLVTMYTCGPTLYWYAHIGNFRTYVFQDILRRYLKYKGFKIKQVMNLTDVDDKTIRGSKKEGIKLDKFTDKYKKTFFDDLKSLNIEKVEVYPEATKHIKEMIKLVKDLLDKGLAYKGKDGSIYYDISKFKDYGKLSHLVLKGLKAGARVNQDEYEKLSAGDFALWKAWTEEDGNVFWESELGKGRPGWHIECSAMSMKYLGETFDIHSGGVDLIFPHHENEIAQSEGSTSKDFAKFWVHGEHLLVEGKKMSKSLGNFYTLRDLIKKGHDPIVIRYLLLSTHYRSKLNFTEKSLKSAKDTLDNLKNFIRELNNAKGKDSDISKLIKKAKKNFEDAMDDDLGISEALSSLFNFVKEVNKLISEKKIGEKNVKDIISLVTDFDKVLGLELTKVKDAWQYVKEAPKEIRELIQEREDARKSKDWKKADKIRDKLNSMSIILEDTSQGIRWRNK